MAEDTVRVWDDLGRPVEIDRESWEQRVLPALLDEVWDDPDHLYGRIVLGLEHASAGRLLDACERLCDLEGRTSERAAVVLAVVLLDKGEPAEAERVLQELLDGHRPTGVVVTNLAKVAAEQGDDARAMDLLRRALELDPNQENGLDWWGALHLERGGEAAWLAAMEEVARIDGSWRAALWIARDHLEQGRVAEALALYERVLPLCAHDADAWMMISGDLGAAGETRTVIELLAPRFELERHGPWAGMNLVRAHLEERELTEAKSLLAWLQRVADPRVSEHLGELERECAQRSELPEIDPAGLRIVWIDAPMWAHGSPEATQLVPLAVPASERVALLSLTDATRAGDGGVVEPATEFGCFARSLPLYLGEVLRFRTDAVTAVYVPVMAGAGPVLPGQPWDLDWLFDRAATPEAARPDLVVHGSLVVRSGAQSIELRITDLAKGSDVGRFDFRVHGSFAGLAAEITESVVDRLEQSGRVRRRWRTGAFEAVGEELLAPYLGASSHLLTQALASNGVIDPDRILDERALLRCYFELAEAMPQALVPRVMAVRGVLAACAYGSPVAAQFAVPLRRLLREAGPDSPLAAFAGAVERVLPAAAG